MDLRVTLGALGFALALAASLVATSAQTADRDAAKQDVAVWADAMGNAFSPGKWEGTMETAENGKTNAPETSVDCFKAGQLDPMFTELRDVFLMVIDSTDCTTQSGGAGSLNLVVDCRRDDGGHMRFASSGAATASTVNWAIDITSDGPGAFPASRMQIASRKIANQC